MLEYGTYMKLLGLLQKQYDTAEKNVIDDYDIGYLSGITEVIRLVKTLKELTIEDIEDGDFLWYNGFMKKKPKRIQVCGKKWDPKEGCWVVLTFQKPTKMFFEPTASADHLCHVFTSKKAARQFLYERTKIKNKRKTE